MTMARVTEFQLLYRSTRSDLPRKSEYEVASDRARRRLVGVFGDRIVAPDGTSRSAGDRVGGGSGCAQPSRRRGASTSGCLATGAAGGARSVGGCAADPRQSFSARHQQVEHDRTSLVLSHHAQLAWQSAVHLREHCRLDRQHQNRSRTSRKGQARQARLSDRRCHQHERDECALVASR